MDNTIEERFQKTSPGHTRQEEKKSKSHVRLLAQQKKPKKEKTKNQQSMVKSLDWYSNVCFKKTRSR